MRCKKLEWAFSREQFSLRTAQGTWGRSFCDAFDPGENVEITPRYQSHCRPPKVIAMPLAPIAALAPRKADVQTIKDTRTPEPGQAASGPVCYFLL